MLHFLHLTFFHHLKLLISFLFILLNFVVQMFHFPILFLYFDGMDGTNGNFVVFLIFFRTGVTEKKIVKSLRDFSFF